MVALLCFIIAVFIIWGLYKLVHMDNVFGDIMRISWNASMHILSIIPGFGFLRHFLVMKDKEKKNEYIREAEKSEAAAVERYEEKKAEEYAEELRRKAEEQEWVRKKAWKEDARTDVEFNRDGDRWKYSDETWDESRHV